MHGLTYEFFQAYLGSRLLSRSVLGSERRCLGRRRRLSLGIRRFGRHLTSPRRGTRSILRQGRSATGKPLVVRLVILLTDAHVASRTHCNYAFGRDDQPPSSAQRICSPGLSLRPADRSPGRETPASPSAPPGQRTSPPPVTESTSASTGSCPGGECDHDTSIMLQRCPNRDNYHILSSKETGSYHAAKLLDDRADVVAIETPLSPPPRQA